MGLLLSRKRDVIDESTCLAFQIAFINVTSRLRKQSLITLTLQIVTQSTVRLQACNRSTPQAITDHACSNKLLTTVRLLQPLAALMNLLGTVFTLTTRRDRRRPTAHVPPPSLFGSLFGCNKCFVNMSAPVAAMACWFMTPTLADGNATGAAKGPCSRRTAPRRLQLPVKKLLPTRAWRLDEKPRQLQVETGQSQRS